MKYLILYNISTKTIFCTVLMPNIITTICLLVYCTPLNTLITIRIKKILLL